MFVCDISKANRNPTHESCLCLVLVRTFVGRQNPTNFITWFGKKEDSCLYLVFLRRLTDNSEPSSDLILLSIIIKREIPHSGSGDGRLKNVTLSTVCDSDLLRWLMIDENQCLEVNPFSEQGDPGEG